MQQLARRLEALLFISPRPVSIDRLADACGCSEAEAEAALEELRTELAQGLHGIEALEIAGGFTLSVADDCAEEVRRLTGAERPDELSPALLETLAVVAYLEPVTRAEIAEVRGVSSEWALGSLEERGLVEQRGRGGTPGAPILYATSQRFLKLFGLGGRADLPDFGEFALAATDVEALRARLHANAERRRV